MSWQEMQETDTCTSSMRAVGYVVPRTHAAPTAHVAVPAGWERRWYSRLDSLNVQAPGTERPAGRQLAATPRSLLGR